MKPPRTISSRLTQFTALTLAAMFMALTLQRTNAALSASDTACNDSGNNSNGGTGFSPWITTIGTDGGIYTATASGAPLGSNGCSTYWGIYTGPNVVLTEDQRPFTNSGTLSVGQTITVDMQNGGIQNGGSEGLTLWNTNNNLVWELHFSGGSNNWTLVDNSGSRQTTFPYVQENSPASALRVFFTLTGPTNYSVRAQAPVGGTSYGPYTGALLNPAGGSAISQLRFYTYNIGNNFNLQFNNLSVTCPDMLRITNSPTAQTNCLGTTAAFSVSGISGDSVTYQWQRNGTNITNGPTGSGATYGGATTATLSITNVQSADDDAATNGYACVVEDACGDLAFSSTNALTVVVSTAAGATLNHASDTICAGSTESVTATPTGTATGGNWTTSGTGGFSGSNTDSTVYTPSAADIMAGTVTLTFTTTGPASPCGPGIAQDVVTISPTSVGGTATAASASFLPGLSTTITLSNNTGMIQWQGSVDDVDFTNIPGATSAVYATPALTQTTYYQAVVTSGACSSSTSTVAMVTVSTVPGITTEPTNTAACSGSAATFTAAASGSPLSYAWFKHANAGWGSPWTVVESGGTVFLNSSTDNNNNAPNCDSFSGYGDINTSSGNAWGLYGPEQVTRTFPAPLTNGQVFQIDMDNGSVNTGLSDGFSLHNSSNSFLFTFYFPGGGSNYVYSDSAGAHTTSVPFTVNGLRIAVIVGAGNPASYSLLITPCGGGTVEYSGVFATTNTPGIVLLYNNNTSEGSSAYNLYFNNIYAGLAYDNADNYGANWSGVDSGDASPIDGATNASYSTITGANGDLYYAVAYNGFGAAVSSVAGLIIAPPRTTTPVISPSGTVPVGTGAVAITETLLSGIAPFSYQWQSNGVAVGTAVDSSDTTNELVLDTAGFAAGSYNYSVVATDCSGSSTSAPVTLNIAVPSQPVVSQGTTPAMVSTYAGGTATFQAAFIGTAPISYQWEFTTDHVNYVDLPGATGTTLALSSVQSTNAGYYSLWASNVVNGGYTVSSGDAQLVVLAGSPPPNATITNALGLAVAVNGANGTYTLTSTAPAWQFAGSVGGGLSINNVDYNSGVDGLGSFNEITFAYTNGTSQTAAIRLYDTQPIVLFTDTILAATPNANFSFPNLSTYPAGLSFVGFAGLWGNYTFSTYDQESPWLFFDTNFNSFIISSATNYLIASNSLNSGTISCGIDAAIPTLPAGFTHRVILVINNGINNTYNTWGNALTMLSGKVRVANDAAVELNKVGYWTDNGATYYYNFVGSYLSTLQTISAEFTSKGFPLGYMQLDSWWYPKGAADTWEGDPDNNRGGIYTYTADPTLFPTGLASFQQQLGGLPLITHARWIDPASPYQSEYAMSADVSVDPRYWSNIMTYIQSADVVTYEQDWMNQMAAPNLNLTDPPNFMNDMAAAAATNGLNMQYCMPTPKIYLQGSQYNNLMTMRVCVDVFQRSHWDAFIYDSRLVSALGAFPWTDVEYTTDLMDALIGTLSAGPVGFGDAIGNVNAANLANVARSDSVIVKPDAPLLPVDQTYLNDAQGNGLPMIASTYTDFGGQRAYYVFSYARSSGSVAGSFTPSSLGASNNVYIYNYFAATGNVMSASSPLNFNTTVATAGSGATYFVVAPVGASGIALVGDTNKFVTLGKKRISALADSDGVLHATVAFASGEASVTLAGYAPSAPYVTINNGSVMTASYNPSSQWFTFTVPSGGSGSADVALSLNSSNLVPQPLQISRVGGGQLTLSWGGTGTLLQSTNVNGPWTTNAAAVSPYPVSPTGTRMFFKLTQ